MAEAHPLRTDATTWVVLLGLTILMLSLESAALPGGLFVSPMIVAMPAKVSIISAHFMHLRFERVTFAIVAVLAGRARHRQTDIEP